MDILIPIALIAGGLVSIFYLRTKTKNDVTEIKYMQTKKISDLKEIFQQMSENGLENDYREYVELKGIPCENGNLVQTPFSNQKVIYCESKVKQVVEEKKQYTDKDNNIRTRVSKREIEISNEKSSQDILISDSSSDEKVVVEINATGSKVDIPLTFDRFEPKTNLNQYNYFRSFPISNYGAETLGFKMTERIIKPGQNLYVIGEAFKVGDTIHIGKPQDSKKPFIITTKSEDDLINSSNQKAMIYLIGGIIAIIVGIAMFFR